MVAQLEWNYSTSWLPKIYSYSNFETGSWSLCSLAYSFVVVSENTYDSNFNVLSTMDCVDAL